MRSFLTTDAPRSGPPRRFESQLSFESIGLFSLIHKYIQLAFVRHTTLASIFVLFLYSFVSILWCLHMFDDHLFIQSFDCILIYSLRHGHINCFEMCISIWIGIFELIWSKNKEEEMKLFSPLIRFPLIYHRLSHNFITNHFICALNVHENCIMSLYRLTQHSYDSWFIAFFYANTPIFSFVSRNHSRFYRIFIYHFGNFLFFAFFCFSHFV